MFNGWLVCDTTSINIAKYFQNPHLFHPTNLSHPSHTPQGAHGPRQSPACQAAGQPAAAYNWRNKHLCHGNQGVQFSVGLNSFI